MSVPGTQLSPPPEAALQTYPFALADLPYAYGRSASAKEIGRAHV